MNQDYKRAATKLEQIQKENVKQIRDDVNADLTTLISELKVGVKRKRHVETKFEALERAIKTKQARLWKQIEEIRNSLETGSIRTIGASNSHLPPEHNTRPHSGTDNEMSFMEECLTIIIESLESNSDTQVFPKPDERLKEKIGKGYGYALKVASLCKQRKSDLERASDIIEDLYNQAMEVNDDQKQAIPEKPTTKNSKKESNIKTKTVPKTTEPGMASKLEKKGTAVSTALKKMEETKFDFERASKIIGNLYNQAVEINSDQAHGKAENPTTTSSKTRNEDTEQTDPRKRKLEMASELEMKGATVSSALKNTKGDLIHASKIIEDLYKQAMETIDDKQPGKQETATHTSYKKGGKDKEPTVPVKTEPNMASDLEMKGTTVSSALKKMEDMNGDLERASKIIEDLYNQAVEVNNEKGQSEPKKQKLKMASELKMTSKAGPSALKNAKGVFQNQTVKFNVGQAQGNQKTLTNSSSNKKGGKGQEETVPKETELNMASGLKMKGTTVSTVLKKMEDTRGDLMSASKIIEDLYNQAMECNDDQGQGNPEKSTTKSKKESNNKAKTVSVSDTTEPGMASQIETKGRAVSTALKEMEDTKEGINQLKYQIECLEHMLADLNKSISEGGKEPVALCGSDEMKDESQAYESARQIFQTFKEKKRHVEKLKDENELLVGLLNALHESVTRREDLLSKKQSSATPGNGLSGYNIASKIFKTFQEMETDAQMHVKESHCLESIMDDLFLDVQDLEAGETSKKTQLALDIRSKSIKKEKERPTYKQFEKAKKIYKIQVDLERDARRNAEEKHLLETILDDLFMDVHNLEKGVKTQPALDVRSKSIEKERENTTYKPLEQAKKIYAIQVDMKRSLIEKDRLEDKLRNLQEVVAVHEANIKESEKKIMGLQENTERESKQSKESLRKLQDLNGENTELKKDIGHLRTRLSEIAGAKLTHNNPSIADLSDPNRPTKLAEKYSEIYDNQWTDAFSILSKYNANASDEELAGYLYNILADGYHFCARVRMRQKNAIEDVLLHPDVNMEFSQDRKTDGVNEIFSKLLSDAAKVSSNVTSVHMVQAFEDNDEMKKKYEKVMVSCKPYIEECVKLCWHMQVQTPPIYMDLKTVKKQAFQKNIYREYTSKGKYIDFVVWPALFLHEGGPLLFKGIAQGE